MADNYLEKRMEDMAKGKLKPVAGSRSRVNNRYKNLRAFVTGGANGIGKAIVEELRKLGCKVAFCDIDKENGERLSQVYGATFLYVDVTKAEDLKSAVESLLKDWGDMDILVNNVGIGDFKPFEDCSLADFEKVMKTNLYPVFITSNVLARHRKERMDNGKPANSYGGRIINISSTRHIQSEEGTVAYSATKGAVFSLTHSLMMSLAKYRITVNCISPGWINTDPSAEFSDADKLQHPSGRIGKPEDIGRLVSFLCHPGNDFINGQDIVVDGGMTRQMIYSGDHGWEFSIHNA